MNKKSIYFIIVISLIFSFGFMYQSSRTTTTFNLIDEESNYRAYVQSWLKEHKRLSEECPIVTVGENTANIQNECVKLKEVRKVLESFKYDENLVPEKYKELNTKLKDSVNTCLYAVDQLMEGLLHSDNNLIKLGKESLIKAYLTIDEIREELEKID